MIIKKLFVVGNRTGKIIFFMAHVAKAFQLSTSVLFDVESRTNVWLHWERTWLRKHKAKGGNS